MTLKFTASYFITCKIITSKKLILLKTFFQLTTQQLANDETKALPDDIHVYIYIRVPTIFQMRDLMNFQRLLWQFSRSITVLRWLKKMHKIWVTNLSTFENRVDFQELPIPEKLKKSWTFKQQWTIIPGSIKTLKNSKCNKFQWLSLSVLTAFSRWTWVSRCLLKQRMVEVVVTTGAISRAKLQSNHHHQQTNTHFFTGRMPFLSPNQQCQRPNQFPWWMS